MAKKILLSFEFSQKPEIKISLTDPNESPTTFAVSISTKEGGANNILSEVVKILQQNYLSLSDICGLGVIGKTNHFTTSRIATLIANTISWLLNIPVFNAPSTHNLWSAYLQTKEKFAQSKNQLFLKTFYPQKILVN